MALSKRSGAVDSLSAALARATLGPRLYLICFDTEGTARSGGIREIGAVALDDDAATFYDVVTQPSRAKGLSAEDAARTWGVVGPRFFAWVRTVTPEGHTAVLVGHNAGCHDVPLLRSETRNHCPTETERVEELRWADTLPAVRACLPELKRRDQASVYSSLFGREPASTSRHTALADARANAAIARTPEIRKHLEKNNARLFG